MKKRMFRKLCIRSTAKAFVISTLLLAGACSKDGTEPGGNSQTGDVKVTLQASDDVYGINVLAATTKTEVPFEVSTDDFKVEFINSSGVVSKQWSKFSEMDNPVRLNVDTYTFRASYGSADAAGFELPYFLGEEKFTLKGQDNTDLSVTCALANAMLIVEFGPNLSAEYSDYRVEIRGAGTSPTINYLKSETRPAFVPVGSVALTIYLTNGEGQERAYSPDAFMVTAKQCVTVKLDTKESTGKMGLSITTDDSTIDINEEIEINHFMLPKPAPTIYLTGLDAEGKLTLVEGTDTEISMDITAKGAIKSCFLTVNSAQLRAAGWPEKIDLADTEASTKALLKAAGLVWLEDMKGYTLSYIDFTGLVRNLQSDGDNPSQHAFTVLIEDNVGNTQSVEETIEFTVNPPAFSLGSIAASAVWANHADITVDLQAGNPDIVQIEWKSLQSDWQMALTEATTTSGNTRGFKAKGLPDGQDVWLRVRYNDHVSEEVKITTEELLQVPNAGFEDWYHYEVYKKTIWSVGTTGLGIDEWFAYQNGETDTWWSSRNPLTTSQRSGTSCYYTSFSGAQGVADPRPGSTGSMAAWIATVGWGEGNTYPFGAIGTVKNKTAGMLFIGDYDLENRNEIMGRPFTSRPSKLSFYYKYAPVNAESFRAYAVIENRDNGGVTELARAEITSAEEQSDYTKAVLDFDYTRTDLKATHLYIVFLCSTADTPDIKAVGGNKGALDGYSDSRYLGSILTVDDVELIY